MQTNLQEIAANFFVKYFV